MLVRRAVLEDLEQLVSMCVELWPDRAAEEHRLDPAATIAGAPQSTLPLELFVAEDGDGLIEFIEVGLRSHADGCDASRPAGFVEGWHVAADRQRQGVGRALMDCAEVWARGHGASEIGSDTWLDNDASSRAHAALGFEVVDRCVHFRKALGPASEPPSAVVRTGCGPARP